MRKKYFELLLEFMKVNPQIVVFTADLGYIGFDTIQKIYPERFVNTGASEQAMMDMAIGASLSGMIPFTYTITPFYLRAFEALRTYINHEKIKVIMAGSGRDKDYEHDGVSHWADDMPKLLDTLPNIVQFYPENNGQLQAVMEAGVYGDAPTFISLSRKI